MTSEHRAKVGGYKCGAPDCRSFFKKPRETSGGFKVCSICGALNYVELCPDLTWKGKCVRWFKTCNHRCHSKY